MLPALGQALATARNAVQEAPPGTGKTTRVPLALLDAPWLAKRKIVMLEPRRLAARAAAARMADTLGEQIGQTVGYRIRPDTRIGPKTRIEVVIEGILTRMVRQDPFLEGVGLVIFDEFHERNLHGDLGLALCLDVQRGPREDLRLLAMSATLEPDLSLRLEALAEREAGRSPAGYGPRDRPAECWRRPRTGPAVWGSPGPRGYPDCGPAACIRLSGPHGAAAARLRAALSARQRPRCALL